MLNIVIGILIAVLIVLVLVFVFVIKIHSDTASILEDIEEELRKLGEDDEDAF